MAKENKGLLFFYDWRDPIEELSGDEVKSLLLAMLDFSKDGTEPPQFKGGAKIAAAFMFPAIDRFRKQSEAGRKGGTTTQEARRAANEVKMEAPFKDALKDASKGATKGGTYDSSRVVKQQHNTTQIQDNTIIKCDLVVEREPQYPQEASTPTQGEGCFPPSLEEVAAYCREIQSTVSAQTFHSHYSGNGWTVNGIPLHDWRAKLRYWDAKDREQGKTTLPENVPGYTPPHNPLDEITFD